MMYKAKVTVGAVSHTEHKFSVINMQNCLMLNQVVRIVTGRL
jgi:hypothetical protein